ncbi:MAG TPA: hypothetical protein VES36_05165 [Candidatus Limnocylindrales bacterium]|nr:hypothetical protein [Candidatus Limnocylindrales bacterium]
MRRLKLLAVMGAVVLTIALPATASGAIHEKIAAACRAGGEEVRPPGQLKFGSQSFLRALQATGIIESIVVVGDDTTINFDLTKPSSKYMSAGHDLTIPGAFGPGADLTLSPLPILDPTFPAHANCHNLNP